jgi:hypothetical protein
MRNEKQTSHKLIEPALKAAGWQWDSSVIIGPGRENIPGGTIMIFLQSFHWRNVVREK